jgi:hypothetical protein
MIVVPENLFTPIASNYVPQACLISNVTTAINAVVTTSTSNGFYTGQVIRIIVPQAYGMVVSYVQTIIRVIDDTDFITNIDTTGLLPFVAPTFTGVAFTQAQAVPITGLEWNIAPLTGNQLPPVQTPVNTEIFPHLPPVYPPAVIYEDV